MKEEESIRIVDYTEIGAVSFIRKPSVRNLKITVRPLKGVQVLVPRFLSFESAYRFVEEKKPWIRKSLLKLAKIKKGISGFDLSTHFQTRDHKLVLEKHAKATIKTVIGHGRITVMFPDFADVSDHRVQKSVRKAIVQAWKLEAAKYLPGMVRQLADKNHLKFSRLTFRDNKTRWGSCSRDNKISLNIHLMRLPDHLCEYVILHELAHTIYKHHQKAFWQYLDQLTRGRARILDKELNGFSPEVW